MPASDEAFGTQDAGGTVERAREGVDGDDMRGFVVPRAVFDPVACAHFVPRVGELVGGAEESHRKDVCAVMGRVPEEGWGGL